jgi:hypothetical protein
MWDWIIDWWRYQTGQCRVGGAESGDLRPEC